MSSDRVLATETARVAVDGLRATVDGQLATDIATIVRHGETLSRPDVWDGQLARAFRDGWPTTARQLETARDELLRLAGEVARIRAAIMQAGGNAA
ncbi:MAG TPA: hypothetical protein VEW93_00640 [Acidimicrobiales bacterium]|nr:hypothetical protein [Acidimicrobiales bacterium]